jgi:choline kinase
MEELPPSALPDASQSREDETPRVQNHYHRNHRNYRQLYKKLVAQVAEWLESEKAKKVVRKEVHQDSTTILEDDRATVSGRSRTSSLISHSSVASLERLQRILEDNVTAAGYERLPTPSPYLGPRTGSQSTGPRRRASTRSTHARHASSDTDHLDGDVIVPSCDVILDNSRTLGYSRGLATPEFNLFAIRKRTEKEHKAWINFKNQILRLAHTLRLKGWRRISLEDCDEIKVERLSGALTNAVYVISPPGDLPPPKATTGSVSARIPNKLLLRIYGPQVGHLIDREQELGILRRLARKRIGPRLIGTFLNGRFEEYFASTTLTSADLRVPETSKQIAKRMRELHDGIDLLGQERRNGPFVWRNWDKWVGRCEYVIQYLDQEILSGRIGTARSRTELWKQRGLVCGVEWPVFRAMVEKCREFLLDYYGGSESIKEKLVFAHNDVSLLVTSSIVALWHQTEK